MEFKDISGQRFGRLVAINRGSIYRQPSGKSIIRWRCQCDCGGIVDVVGASLRGGVTRSCGCIAKEKASLKVKNISGQKFGRLIVLERSGSDNMGKAQWKCQCDCGNTAVVTGASLRSGNTRSCGCSYSTCNGEAKSKTPEYSSWSAMISRCENPRNSAWWDYGGRGVSVCEPWRNDYLRFLTDVGRKPASEYSLDRIDNNGNYEPGNVRWATRKEQNNNRRPHQPRKWRNAAKHAYTVVKNFEHVLSSYTGAPYVVSVDSCTNALLLACKYLKVETVEIPRFTYCSVPMSIMHAGGSVTFRDEDWLGMYQLKPYPIYDSARLMTSNMYISGSLMCLSFHWSKHLPIGHGGAILCDDKKTVEYLKRARFDGRKEGVAPNNDNGLIRGWHVYLTPTYAAQGLMLMASMKEHNDPLPTDDYPDLSKIPLFK